MHRRRGKGAGGVKSVPLFYSRNRFKLLQKYFLKLTKRSDFVTQFAISWNKPLMCILLI